MTTVAHLSDLHLGGAPDAEKRTGAVADYLRALSPGPDVVLVTGDVADHADPREYASARRLLGGLAPWVVPGNHDVAAVLAQSPGLGSAGGFDRVQETADVLVALCDTAVPGAPHGIVSAAALAVLDAAVPDPRPLVVALHHPPVPVGHPYIDGMGLSNPDALAEVLVRRTGPTLLACGHAHMATVDAFAGHRVVVAPAVASTLRAPDEPGAGEVHERSLPGLALHTLTADGPVRTAFRTVF